MKSLHRFGPLAARIALTLIFLLSGMVKLVNPIATGAAIASKGLPLGTFLAVVAGAVELLGGLSVLLGFRSRWGALALAAYLVPVTLVFHNPSGLQGMQAQMQMIEMLKNLGIFGGLLAVASLGPGPLSLDARRAPGPSGALSRG